MIANALQKLSLPTVAGQVAHAVLVLLAASLSVRLAARVIRRMEVRSKGAAGARRATFFRLMLSIVRYVVAFVAALMILAEFHIHTGPLLASAGVIGLAVSFGAQGLVQDIVTGLFLLYEDQFVVGDSITLPTLSLSGTVEEVGIRVLRLRGPGGELISVPNRLILDVKNHSRGQPTSVSIGIPVAPSEDPGRVRRALETAVQRMAADCGPVKLVGVTGLSAGAVIWTVSADAATAAAQTSVDTMIRERVIAAFYEYDVALAGREGRADGQSSV